MFQNRGRPFSCLSTRFGGVNYRVSMLIGMAGQVAKRYINIYNPNFWNQFSVKREGESDEDVKARTNGRWLLSFMKALEHTKRTGGKLVQVRRCPPLEPSLCRRCAHVRCALSAAQPVQTDHKDGKYSDMQKAEKLMAQYVGIPVVEFEFEEGEVSEMGTDGKIKVERDEAAFLKRLEAFLFEIAS